MTNILVFNKSVSKAICVFNLINNKFMCDHDSLTVNTKYNLISI